MELNQLRNFVKVAQTGQLTRAAKELHIAQPNMSSSIHLLEKELGTPLFDRTGRSLVLNENGKIFYESVSKALNTLDDGIEELQKRKNDRSTDVYLTVLAGMMVLPDLLQKVRTQVPEAHLSLLKQDLQAHPRAWDIAIYASIEPKNDDGRYTLVRQPFCLIVPEGHPLSSRDSVTLREVSSEPLITWPGYTLMGQMIRDYFHEEGCTPNIVLETDNGELTAQLVKAGMGVAFAFPGQFSAEGTHYLSISQPECARYIIAECRSERPIVKKVLSCIIGQPYRDYTRSAVSSSVHL